METPIDLRDAGMSDAADILALMQALATETGEHDAATEAAVREYLQGSNGTILLAGLDGRIAGLISYSLRPDLYHAAPVCLIEGLIVHALSRGRGIGSALMKEVLARAAARGCAEIAVAVMPENRRALSFYRRHGLSEEAILLERHFGR